MSRPTASLISWIAAAVLLGTPLAAQADPLCQNPPEIKAANKIPLKAFAFDLKDIRLLEGPFRHAMELDKQYLLSLDVNRLLHVFRLNAGIATGAKPLGGWEDPSSELRGHFVGHYLSACSMMYGSTGDEQLKQRADAVVAGLAECQAALGTTGYLSAYPEYFFTRLETATTMPWAPYYTLHKIYAGLLEAYVHCGNQQALDVCKKAGDWVVARNAKLTDEQLQKVLGNEFGGMNEVLANLYGLTGDDKYLAVAKRFNHMAVLDPAAKREDKLTGLHANTQIPKFVGAAREYELTGDDWFRSASTFFWDTVTKERSYAIGGHSDSECFSPKEKLSQALGPITTETCNTYNMLKLTRHLFCWEPRPEIADFYERALLNHILASQNPQDGMMCYYAPLRANSKKLYNGPLDCFWCCTGTGVENHAKYGDSIYFHDGGQTLLVNLFIPSELNWKAKGLKVRQETTYPVQPGTRLTIACDKPTELSISIRRPWWAVAAFEVRVNDQLQTIESTPGSYVTLARTWSHGDRVDVSMPFSLRIEAFRDNPRRFALMHGPLVLCAEVDPKTPEDMDTSNKPFAVLRGEQVFVKPYPGAVGDAVQLLNSLKPVEGRPSTFTASADLFRMPGNVASTVTVEPFYQMHGGRRYVVYWDQFSPAEWDAAEAERKAEIARIKDIEDRTVDRVNVGDDANERAHNLQGERTAAGDYGGRKWRHATDGGWFSWDVKVQPDQSQHLAITYWGSDYGREFDVLVDGVKIARQKLQNNRPGEFFDEIYPLSKDVTAGKEKVTVRLQGLPGGFAGGAFGCRVLKEKS